MRFRKLFLVFSIVVVLAAMATLTRCGTGLSEGYDANLSGMKF